MPNSSDSEAEMRELKFKMATELAHELRTPLGGIVGINELMMMSELSAEQQQFSETIQDSAKSMLQLLTDVVELARLEAEKVAPKANPFNLQTSLDECKYMLKKYLKTRNIELQINHNGVPDTLNGDSKLIQQFVCGIVLAASKYIESGAILLDTSTNDASDAASNVKSKPDSDTASADTSDATSDAITIKFKFTLPPNTVNRSGQPIFNQLANESDPVSRFDSTWLRLTIAHKILKLMNAELKVHGNELSVAIEFAN